MRKAVRQAATVVAFAAGVVVALGPSASVLAQGAWEAPAAEKGKKNPLPDDKATREMGEKVAKTNCVSCHGAKGKGDGSGIAFLAERTSRRPKDLSDKKLQAALSDGEIFWKVTNGLKEDAMIVMPAYANELKKDEDRWALVHFVRTLAGRD